MSIFQELHDKGAFDSSQEQERLERNLKELIVAGIVTEVPVKTPMTKSGLGEHWYSEKASGETYRYLPPEFPDRGVWEKV